MIRDSRNKFNEETGNKIKNDKKKKGNRMKGKERKSKFFEKYSERIQSIQESDLKQKEKKKMQDKKIGR